MGIQAPKDLRPSEVIGEPRATISASRMKIIETVVILMVSVVCLCVAAAAVLMVIWLARWAF